MTDDQMNEAQSLVFAGEILTTPDLVLRAPTRDDVADIAVLANNHKVSSMLEALPYPYYDKHAEEFIDQVSKPAAGECVFAITDAVSGKLMGMCGLHLVNRRFSLPHMGYWLGEEFWGKGYVTEGARTLLDHAFGPLGRDVDAGFSAYKIKIGENLADDVARVRLARDIIGPDALLMVDVNGAYNAETAYASMRRIEDHDIHWIEEPVASDDFEGLKRLGERRTISIATGESHMTCIEFKRLFDTGAVDVLMPDLTLCGGIDEGQGAVLLTRLYGARLSPHVWGTGIGLAAAVHYTAALPRDPFAMQPPFPSLVEYDRSPSPMRDDLLREPILPAAGGILPVPQGPGLGIEVDEAVLAAHTVA